MSRALPALVSERLTDGAAGVTSMCTAHPMVIEAALLLGARAGRRVLIEATCNQVNQEGGYTGMTPADFRGFVEAIAARVGFDPARIMLGGDHLGPNPWKHLPAEEAMGRAEDDDRAYARAGFVKLHLDASMGCAGERGGLPTRWRPSARRSWPRSPKRPAAQRPCLRHRHRSAGPRRRAARARSRLTVDRPEAALRDGRSASRRRSGCAASRAPSSASIGVVVQPGVEFASAEVVAYDRTRRGELVASLADMPNVVFEAHSTDYQPAAALEALVRDGFAILKVGPWLTFALREALYGLDWIAQVLCPAPLEESLPATMEALMLGEPENWRAILRREAPTNCAFSGTSASATASDTTGRVRRRGRPSTGSSPGSESGSFRSRWSANISADSIRRSRMARLPARPRELAIAAVQRVLARYDKACRRSWPRRETQGGGEWVDHSQFSPLCALLLNRRAI